jgi:hypothetical protein
MQALLPPVERGITSLFFAEWREGLGFGDGWACLRHGVTFEHRQVLPWVVKGRGMSVKEATMWIWWQWGGVAPPQKEMR